MAVDSFARLLAASTASSTYTKDEVNKIIGDLGTVSIEVADELPTKDIKENKIYFIPTSDEEDNEYYDEYIYVEDHWEKIGDSKFNIEEWYVGDGTIRDIIDNNDISAEDLGKVINVENLLYFFANEGKVTYIKNKDEDGKFILTTSSGTAAAGSAAYKLLEKIFGLVQRGEGVNFACFMTGGGTEGVYTTWTSFGDTKVSGYGVIPAIGQSGTIGGLPYRYGRASFAITYDAERDTYNWTRQSEEARYTDISATPELYESVNNITASRVLGVKNTKEYVPTDDYNPATKKYVDDSTMPLSVGFMINSTDTDEEKMQKLTQIMALKSDKKAFDVTYNDSGILYSLITIGGIPTGYGNMGAFFSNEKGMTSVNQGPIPNSQTHYRNIFCLLFNYDTETKQVTKVGQTTETYYTLNGAQVQKLLYMDNGREYTPTGNYNPATKKYVDDAVAGIEFETLVEQDILDIIGGAQAIDGEGASF